MAKPLTKEPSNGLSKLCTTSPVILLSFVMVTVVFNGGCSVPVGFGTVAMVRNRLRVRNSRYQRAVASGRHGLLLRIVPGVNFGRTEAGLVLVCCMHRVERFVQGAQHCQQASAHGLAFRRVPSFTERCHALDLRSGNAVRARYDHGRLEPLEDLDLRLENKNCIFCGATNGNIHGGGTQQAEVRTWLTS